MAQGPMSWAPDETQMQSVAPPEMPKHTHLYIKIYMHKNRYTHAYKYRNIHIHIHKFIHRYIDIIYILKHIYIYI